MRQLVLKAIVTRRLFAPAAAAMAGAVCSLLVSSGLFAGIELVPNGKKEKRPDKFCVYEVQSASGKDCTKGGIIGGREICTQCPNDANRKRCRPNSIAMQNVKLADGDCVAILKTISDACTTCESGVPFYWLEEK